MTARELHCRYKIAVCDACGWQTACTHFVLHDCDSPAVPAPPATPAPPGPGAHLSLLLGRLGFSEKPGCKCKSFAAQMDKWGADGCATRVSEILNVLRDEAARRGLPFLDVAGRLLIGRAIANARRSLATTT